MELEEANAPLYESQKVNYLLKGVKNDNIQVQTTLAIIHIRYLNNFDDMCLTLWQSVSSCFTYIEPGHNKRSIGAVKPASGRRPLRLTRWPQHQPQGADEGGHEWH